MRASTVDAPPAYATNDTCPAPCAPPGVPPHAGARRADCRSPPDRAATGADTVLPTGPAAPSESSLPPAAPQSVEIRSVPPPRLFPAARRKTPATLLARNCSHSPNACSSGGAEPGRGMSPQQSVPAGSGRPCNALADRLENLARSPGPVSIVRTPGCPPTQCPRSLQRSPTRPQRSTMPRWLNSQHQHARPTVIREVPKRCTNAASLGNFCPGGYLPERISCDSFSNTWRYFGTFGKLLILGLMVPDITAFKPAYSNLTPLRIIQRNRRTLNGENVGNKGQRNTYL